MEDLVQLPLRIGDFLIIANFGFAFCTSALIIVWSIHVYLTSEHILLKANV